MKKISMRLLVVVCVFFAYNLLANVNVFASGRAIAISPTNERIVLIPGETFRGGFNVVNPNDAESDLHFLVSVGSYNVYEGSGSKDDYGEVDLINSTSWNQIMNWTTIVNETGVVVPNGEATVEFTINVPEDAPAGGQYMTLLVRENPEYAEVDDNTLGVKETMQMAFVVFAEVAGNTRQVGEVLENSFPTFLLNNHLEAISMVKNDGNIHADASYVLQVWPLFDDEEICTNEEDSGRAFVLPDTEKYHIESCDLPPVGIFRAKQTVEIFGEVSTLEKTIIVCPLWLMFVVIFAIIAIIICFIMRAKSRKRRIE